MADYVLPSQRKNKVPPQARHGPVAPTNHVLPSQTPQKAKSWSLLNELSAIPGDIIRGTLGVPGDIEALTTGLRHKYQSFMGMSDADIAKEQRLETAASGGAPFPTGDRIVSGLQRRGVPIGNHETKTGQAAGAVISGIPAAVLTGGESIPASAAESIAPSLGAWGLGEAAKGTPYEVPASIAGGVLTHSAQRAGLGAGRFVRNLPAARAANSDRLAAQAYQHNFPNPDARAAAALQLAQHKSSPVAGYKPTTAQILGTPQAAKFEKSVSDLNARPGVEEPISAQRNAAVSAAPGAPMEGTIWKKPAFDESGAPHMPVAPKGDASADLHYHLSKLADDMKSNEKANWAAVEASPNLMHGAPLIDDLKNKIGSLASQDEKAMSGPMGILKDLDSKYGSGTNPSGRGFGGVGILGVSGGRNYNPMPAAELQSLRSSVLRAGRNTENPGLSKNLGDLGASLAGHLELPSNYLENGEKAASDWAKANKSTADYHGLFGSNEPGSAFADVDKNGAPIKSPFSVIDGITSDPQKYQSLRDNPLLPDPLRSVVDDTVGRAKISDITKNGSILPTPQKIDAAVAGKDFDNFRRVHPDLAERANDLRNASLQKGFSDAVTAGPGATKDFLDAHKLSILDAVNPEHRPLIEGIHQATSEVLPKSLPEGSVQPPIPNPTLDNIKLGGNQLLGDAHGHGIADAIHYGEKAATMGLPIADMLAHGKIGATRLLGEELVGNAADRRFGTPWVNALSNKILGDTREQTIAKLAKTQTDPEYAAKMLSMDATTPKTDSLGQVLGRNAAQTSLRIPPWASGQHSDINSETPTKQNYPHIEADDSIPLDAVDLPKEGQDDAIPLDAIQDAPQPHAAGGRTGYASGGRAHVNPHTVDRLVNKLMKRLKATKKETSKMTEPLLNHSDESIARALSIAAKGV